jgi:hypothetical protein
VRPSGDEVAVYDVMGDPPVFDGANHDKLTVVPFAVPVTPVGAPGAVRGIVTGADGADAVPAPAAFVATTVKVYVTPRVSPSTVQNASGGDALDVHIDPPGDEVAVYDVIGEPPSLAGTSHDTSTLVPATTPVTRVG